MAMVVMVYHGHEAISFIVAIAMVVMGGMCVQSGHGDGSDGRHVCTKHHGHT